MKKLRGEREKLEPARTRSPVPRLLALVGVFATSGWVSCAAEPAVLEPRLLEAHKLNVTYFGESAVDSPPAALVDLFAGCYELEFEPGAGRTGWPERLRFELTRSPGRFPGTLRVRSSFGNSNQPDWSCLDAFTAIVDWPPKHNPWFEILLRLEPSGFSVRTNQDSARVLSVQRVSCGESENRTGEGTRQPSESSDASAPSSGVIGFK